jgi:hypothetical protein
MHELTNETSWQASLAMGKWQGTWVLPNISKAAPLDQRFP